MFQGGPLKGRDLGAPHVFRRKTGLVNRIGASLKGYSLTPYFEERRSQKELYRYRYRYRYRHRYRCSGAPPAESTDGLIDHFNKLYFYLKCAIFLLECTVFSSKLNVFCRTFLCLNTGLKSLTRKVFFTIGASP